MLKNSLQLLLICCLISACNPSEKNETEQYFDLMRSEISGATAFETTAYVEQYWRIAGNSGFNKSIDHIVKRLETAGYVNESQASQMDRMTFRIETYEMEEPTWEPVNARVTFAESDALVLEFSSNRNMININSASTPESGIQAEVVQIDSLPQLDQMNVEGKLVYAQMHPYRLYQKAITEGKALGLITYSNPDYLQPEKNQTSIQFKSIPFVENSDAFGISLSYAANTLLLSKLNDGKVVLDVAIETKQYPSVERTVVACIKGAQKPDEGLVFSAHVQEPGANDNASGVGAQLEMAVAMANLIKTDELDVNRTLTFLWGDEIISTRRYVNDSLRDNPKTKWGISLDMVGENTAVTGGSFLIEKMPDPSAIWTRGEDKHTEWGGRPLTKDDMQPHYLNDFVVSIFEEQGSFANWEVNTNPFEGGSDHVPFLRKDIPSVLFWHFTDQFYHTDNDRLDKVSQTTLKNVTTSALVAALVLLNCTDETADAMVDLIANAAKERLTKEAQLGETNLKNNGDLATELDIITTWEAWYSKALESIQDLEPTDTSRLRIKIDDAQQQLSSAADSLRTKLQKIE